MVRQGTRPSDVEPGFKRSPDHRGERSSSISGGCMHLRTKLVALGVLASFVVPSQSQATDFYALGQVFREVKISTVVQHSATGKKGTLTLTLRQSQGTEFYKDPLGQDPIDHYLLSHHIGVGPQGSVGGSRFEGCMDLIIKGVIERKNRCRVVGTPQLEFDPSMTTIALSAGFGAPQDFTTTVNLDLEGIGTIADEGQSPNTQVSTQYKGAGYDVSMERSVKRDGIVRLGTIFDPVAESIWVRPTASDTVEIRQGIKFGSHTARGPLRCVTGQPNFVIGIGQIHVTDVDPNGCYPDDQLPL